MIEEYDPILYEPPEEYKDAMIRQQRGLDPYPVPDQKDEYVKNDF